MSSRPSLKTEKTRNGLIAGLLIVGIAVLLTFSALPFLLNQNDGGNDVIVEEKSDTIIITNGLRQAYFYDYSIVISTGSNIVVHSEGLGIIFYKVVSTEEQIATALNLVVSDLYLNNGTSRIILDDYVNWLYLFKNREDDTWYLRYQDTSDYYHSIMLPQLLRQRA